MTENNVVEIGYSPAGDSPAWAAAKAAARDVMEGAARKHNPFDESASVLEHHIEARFAVTLEREIADALFKAWQKP